MSYWRIEKNDINSLAITPIQVVPSIPKPLQFLEDLSRNMWWCWNKDAIELFRRIDPPLWVEARRNPIFFLSKIPQSRFEKLAKDKGFLAHLKGVKEQGRTSAK